MREDFRDWLDYAEENLLAAEILFEEDLFNPSLQNSQQAVEKGLKALLSFRNIPVERTHSILRLVELNSNYGMAPPLSEKECDLLDSIYLPSKYPLGGVLPDFEPDRGITQIAVDLAGRVIGFVKGVLQSGDVPLQ